MKRSIITAIYALLFFNLNAQDLIVTTKGDSLKCKIENFTVDSLYFNFTNSDGVEFNTHIPRNQVSSYMRNYYTKKQSSVRNHFALEDLNNVMISINGGLGYRVGEVDPRLPSNMEDYMEGLRTGPILGVDALIFFGYTSGIRLKYSRFFSYNSMYNATVTTVNGNTFHGDVSDNISISYFGPSYATRLLSANAKHVLTGSFGFGYLAYNDDGELGDDIIIKGKTLGLSMDIGYALTVAENLAIGIQTSILRGVLRTYDVEYRGQNETIELEEDYYENLGRIDISLRLIILM